MAYEQFRIYGYNQGTEPEHYRLHVRDHRTDYGPYQHGEDYRYQSSPGADYMDRARIPRPEDYVPPYSESTHRSKHHYEQYSTEDYISPPTDSRDDYISPGYDEPTRKHFSRKSHRQSIPGGFSEGEEERLSWPSISGKEQQSIHRLMKEAKFGNEHEIMRAYWVPQEYDENPVNNRISSGEERSRSRHQARRDAYESDIQTYVEDSEDEEQGRDRGYDSDEDGDDARERWMSKSRKDESEDSEWNQPSRMPGGYASSSPSIQYESEEEHTEHRRSRRYTSPSSPGREYDRRVGSSGSSHRWRSVSSSRKQRQREHHSRRRHASSSPDGSHWSQHTSPNHRRSASTSPRTRRPRVQRAPSPPSAITRRHSASSVSVYIGSDDEVSVRYDSDMEGSGGIGLSGSERARYIGSDDSDVCSDFMINGGSDCDFEGDDIWNSSGSDEGGYDEE